MALMRLCFTFVAVAAALMFTLAGCAGTSASAGLTSTIGPRESGKLQGDR
jgi:hypothetical protein